jgi:RNA polymerase sigma-70 factor (ECF subfamily)
MSTGDESLVRACLKGDLKAFEKLLDRYEKTIFNVALRMVNDREDASDITQSVFTKAFEKLDSFNFEHRFYSWIYRIAINESIKLLERRRPDRVAGEVPAKGQSTPEEIVSGTELAWTVRAALMGIRADYRTVLVLRHYLQCSYREMGEILQVPEKTVKSRLFTARQSLRDALIGMGVR